MATSALPLLADYVTGTPDETVDRPTASQVTISGRALPRAEAPGRRDVLVSSPSSDPADARRAVAQWASAGAARYAAARTPTASAREPLSDAQATSDRGLK